MSRLVVFHVNKSNRYKIGLNSLCNRYNNLNDKIPLELLNKSYLAYKIECKKKFLLRCKKSWSVIQIVALSLDQRPVKVPVT
jgi:hypothetical protein